MNVLDADGRSVLGFSSPVGEVPEGRSLREVGVNWADAVPWELEKPYLYRVECRVMKDSRVVDRSLPVTFGFREIWTEGRQLMLNGHPMRWRPAFGFQGLWPPSGERCPFCGLDAVWLCNDHGIAIRDRFPIAPGHTLVVPRLHIPSLFALPEAVQLSLWSLVTAVRTKPDAEFHPDGFNIGVNDGAAAGQTVGHAHIHVILRFRGDVADPRGGVRWIIPAKAQYWR